MADKKMSSSRKHHLKSLMLSIAATRLTEEKSEFVTDKAAHLAENCPALSLPSALEELQAFVKKLQLKVDQVDEERYDLASKVSKADKEIEDLKIKVLELKPTKKPALKRVRITADAMLAALLGSKHKVTMDLRSNLKQVKKEVKEEAKDAVGDWRQNIEDKTDRKKMFETA